MSRIAIRDLGIVLAVSWLVRGAFVAAIGDAHSVDVEHWRGALDFQDEGRNPYESGVLNWPPLWLMVIVALDYAANVLDVGFLTALRVYLVLVESALVVALYFTLLSSGGDRLATRRALLIGIALNPIAIILVCQHGNSDVQVGLLAVLTCAALGAYSRSRDVLLWLAGCLFVGLGILAKTVPLVLAPLLAPGARLAPAPGRALGAVLLLGPAALGMGVILALAPAAVLDHVIGYRSTSGFFGIGGFVDEDFFGVDGREWHRRLFTVSVVAAVLWLGRVLWSAEPLPPDRLFLMVATIFMAVVAFGPGYGSQYAYWFIPALVATYVLLDRRWRQLLVGAYVVAALTYAVEYALVPWLGAYAEAIMGSSDWLTDASDYLDSPEELTLFRLPLLAAYVLLIVAGVRRLARRDRYDAKL